MKIIRADGSIEDRPENYDHQWSPADILAIDIPPENHPIVAGNPNYTIKRQSSTELKADNKKRTVIARQARADKRKTKSEA